MKKDKFGRFIGVKRQPETAIECACGCGTLIKRFYNGYGIQERKFVKGHNIRIQLKEDYNWNRRIGRKCWSKGLTKSTHPSLRKSGISGSKTRKDLYKKGILKIWNKGKKGYKNKNYPKNRKKSNLSEEIRNKKREKWLGKNNPRYNPNKSTYQIYKQKCQFQFNLADYPDEFSLELAHNMFHPFKNKNGFVRDHIFPIKEGFKYNVPSKKIRHPANCKLIPFRRNAQKNMFTSMTKDDLDQKIRKWEENNELYKYVRSTRFA